MAQKKQPLKAASTPNIQQVHDWMAQIDKQQPLYAPPKEASVYRKRYQKKKRKEQQEIPSSNIVIGHGSILRPFAVESATQDACDSREESSSAGSFGTYSFFEGVINIIGQFIKLFFRTLYEGMG